ncbi:hypothetical protein acdb102_26920 [Acidothermaceae bacterium B102]|nr:hypothetical protein acdb102_26920 [Acidothermaceae bacterium B102]
MTTRTLTMSSLTVAGVLARRGLSFDEADLAEAVEQALGRYLSVPGSAPLAASQRATLQAGGLDLDATGAYATAATRTAADYAALVATALSVPEAAARLGVDGSRVRHRIAAGELWALHGSGRRRLLPVLQFSADGGVVPGLSDVLRALPDDLHPLEVAGFLTGRRTDLRLRGRDQSPVDWLVRGGGVADVVAAAAGVRDRLL